MVHPHRRIAPAYRENSWVWGLRCGSLIAPAVAGSLIRNTLRPFVISDSKTKLLYQYEDQAPPSCVGTRGGGSDQATVCAFAGSVKSTTQVPAW